MARRVILLTHLARLSFSWPLGHCENPSRALDRRFVRRWFGQWLRGPSIDARRLLDDSRFRGFVRVCRQSRL